jgi:DinB superfamily
MTAENIVNTVRSELIRSIAALDEWFDREQTLMEYLPSSGRCACELLRHLMLTNHFLLTLIDQECESTSQKNDYEVKNSLVDYCLEILTVGSFNEQGVFTGWGTDFLMPTEKKPLNEVRKEIRDQLNRSLILLEKLNQGEGALYKILLPVKGLKKLDVYQCLNFLALYTRKHVGQLQRILEEYNKEFKLSVG